MVDPVDVGLAVLLKLVAPVGLAAFVMWVIWKVAQWSQRNHDEQATLEPARVKIDAELVNDAPLRKCRICLTTSSLPGWHRPSTISVVGGLTGWGRRVRGLPPLYVRARPAFGPAEFCTECSHVRDRKVDRRIHEANLALLNIGETLAIDNQRFLLGLDDECRGQVEVVGRRRLTSGPNGAGARLS